MYVCHVCMYVQSKLILLKETIQLPNDSNDEKTKETMLQLFPTQLNSLLQDGIHTYIQTYIHIYTYIYIHTLHTYIIQYLNIHLIITRYCCIYVLYVRMYVCI